MSLQLAALEEPAMSEQGQSEIPRPRFRIQPPLSQTENTFSEISTPGKNSLGVLERYLLAGTYLASVLVLILAIFS